MILKRIRPPIETIAPLIVEQINAGKEVKISVTGNSMYPLLRGGSDMVTLSKPENISKLDVVFYKRSNGQYVLHRVIRINGNALSIAGDNETELEHSVFLCDCIAKMTYFTRKGKTYSVKNPFYIIYSIFWRLIFPLRHRAVKIIKFIGKCRRRISK